MIRTPLGNLEIQIDGKSIKYQATLMPIDGAFSELDGRYKIAVLLQPDGKLHTIACKIKDYTPSTLDEEEGGENLECKSFYQDSTKLSLGMEGDMSFLNGQRMSDYDYDNELLTDGVQYQILPSTKTKLYVFGVAWLTGYNKENAIQTWLGADPTYWTNE